MTALEQEREALIKAIDDVPPEALPNLLRIVELFKESVPAERDRDWREFRAELAAWDALSDEALAESECGLHRTWVYSA
jgi:hypothetical protein